MTAGRVEYSTLSAGQRLAVKYFVVAMALFLAQMLFGVLAAWQFLDPEFLFGFVDFNVNRMVHINAMVVWMLYGFIGSIFWLVEDEAGVPLVGARLANITFWVLTVAVAIVIVVYLVVQTGPTRGPCGSSTKAASTSKRRAGPTSASSCAWLRSSTTSPLPLSLPSGAAYRGFWSST